MLPVDHIGIAVSDGAAVERLLTKLADSAPALPEDVDRQGVRVRFYGSGTSLETLEALVADSPVAKYLAKRGEGLHHIAFRVADVQTHFDRMRAAGFQPLTEAPLPGASGKRIFFLHPRDTHGFLVEFCQSEKQYPVSFEQCAELEEIMQKTGYCCPPTQKSSGHVVTTSNVLPKACKSLVLHNVSLALSRVEIHAPRVPTLISEVSKDAHYAQLLGSQWPEAQLVILPENSQLKHLPAILLEFWASMEDE